MAQAKASLAETVAEHILTVITEEHTFSAGDKLPNELALSKKLRVSRTTLREAIRILSARGVLEVRRGKGTFVLRGDPGLKTEYNLQELASLRPDLKDLYEMRLIFEPQSAYYAAKRATGKELERILSLGAQVEKLILQKEDRTEVERDFHRAIAKATHNEFMSRLMPILYRAIDSGVQLSNPAIVRDTLSDHRMIMEFLEQRDAEGAKTAMKLHLLHAMRGFGFPAD